MVDTINPQTGQSDNFEEKKQPEVIGNNFYAGFGKPEDVHLNLIGDEQAVQTPTPAPNPISPVQPEMAETPVQSTFSNPVAAPAAPISHQVYSNHGESFNLRLFLLTLGIGAIFVVIVGFASFFMVNSGNNKKLEEEKDTLNTLTGQLNSIKAAPDRLQLPKQQQTEVPQTNVETPTAPPVQEQPIQTPTPAETPASENLGQG